MSDVISIKKNEVLCLEGDQSYDLFKVISGELLICKRNNHMVTPIARLHKDEFFGEMSFFDKSPRSADVIATADTQLQKISHTELLESAPFWLRTMAKSMTERLRDLNKAISQKGIKKQSSEVKPLTIDEQRRLYDLLTQS